MAKRIITKIGDVFCVEVEGREKAYFQYIANDMNQLNSSTIRVFKKRYPMDSEANVEDIVADEVEFYSHTVLKFGIEDGAWYKVGKSPEIGDTQNILFRTFNTYFIGKDYHAQDLWRVWYINQDERFFETLPEDVKQRSLPGSVFTYTHICRKIKEGRYLPASGRENRNPNDDY